MLLSKRPNDPSHAVIETNTYRVGIMSVRIFIVPSWMLTIGKNLAVLPQYCCPILISKGMNDGMKPSIPGCSQDFQQGGGVLNVCDCHYIEMRHYELEQ